MTPAGRPARCVSPYPPAIYAPPCDPGVVGGAGSAVTALLALGSSLLWGASDFLGGTAARRLPAFAVIGASQALVLVLLVPAAVLTGAVTGPVGYLPWGLASGIVGLLALGAFYSALATGTMGVVAPIAATGVVVPVVVGMAGGDRPGVVQVAGILAAIAGVVLVSGPERGDPGRSRRPLVLALGAAVGFGAVIVFLAFGARFSVVMTLVTMRAETVTLLLVVALRRRSTGVAVGDLPLLGVIGIGDGGANAAYALATTTGELSLVAVLGSMYPAVTVLLARQVHGERLRPVQTGGVVIALLGVLLIAAGGGTG